MSSHLKKNDTTLKHLRPEEKTQLNIVVSKHEKKIIEQKAARYTKGNMTEWVRYATVHLDPRKEDLS